MKAQYHLKLDGVGCLALLVLTIAFHWFLASRFPDHGVALGALLWLASIIAGTFIVARAVARDDRERVAKLAAAPCPRCGERIGEARAVAMRDRWKAESSRLVHEAMKHRVRVNPSPTWAGECSACGQTLVFDPEAGSVTRE